MFVNNVLRLDDWTGIEGIFDNVRCIDSLYYESICDNLDFIQKHDKESYTVYSVELRDAYAHLVKLFEESGLTTAEGKVKINRQLERYLGHMEEMFYDTYLRKIKILLDSLCGRLKGRKDYPVKKMQCAFKISQLRMMNDDLSVEKKKEKYDEVISALDK